MNSDRKLLVQIGLFIFASALAGGYLKERVHITHGLAYHPAPATLLCNSFLGALDYFKEPLGMIAVALYIIMFIRAGNK